MAEDLTLKNIKCFYNDKDYAVSIFSGKSMIRIGPKQEIVQKNGEYFLSEHLLSLAKKGIVRMKLKDDFDLLLKTEESESLKLTEQSFEIEEELTIKKESNKAEDDFEEKYISEEKESTQKNTKKNNKFVSIKV